MRRKHSYFGHTCQCDQAPTAQAPWTAANADDGEVLHFGRALTQVVAKASSAAYIDCIVGTRTQAPATERPIELPPENFSGETMPSLIPIDNDARLRAVQEPDAHGQAALLLTESLIHTLVENSAITNVQAIELIRIAAEVKVEVATAAHESNGRMKESLALLSKMASSFESDQN
jgi:hypothetical protein